MEQILAFAIFINLLPTLIAYKRKHKNVLPIFLLSFLLPILGWVISLVWSCLSIDNHTDI